MKKVNSHIKSGFNTDGLTEAQLKFYRQAVEKFRNNVSWLEFDEFALGAKSPIFARQSSHLDVLKDPLYLALKDMWLRLGVKQGMIARAKGKRGGAMTAHRSVTALRRAV